MAVMCITLAKTCTMRNAQCKRRGQGGQMLLPWAVAWQRAEVGREMSAACSSDRTTCEVGSRQRVDTHAHDAECMHVKVQMIAEVPTYQPSTWIGMNVGRYEPLETASAIIGLNLARRESGVGTRELAARRQIHLYRSVLWPGPCLPFLACAFKKKKKCYHYYYSPCPGFGSLDNADQAQDGHVHAYHPASYCTRCREGATALHQHAYFLFFFCLDKSDEPDHPTGQPANQPQDAWSQGIHSVSAPITSRRRILDSKKSHATGSRPLLRGRFSSFFLSFFFV